MEWNVYPTEFITIYQQKKGCIVILDVREAHEYEKYHIPNVIFIPFDDLYYRLNEIPRVEDVYVICEHGVRSIQATMMLYDEGHRNVYNIMGGYEKVMPFHGIPIDKPGAS